MLKSKRGNNFRQIVQANPELGDNEDIKTAANSLDELQSLASLSQSEGGKILLDQKKSKAAGLIRNLIAMSKTEHSHESLLGLIARLEACMEIVSELNMAIYNADEQQNFVDQIIEESST